MLVDIQMFLEMKNIYILCNSNEIGDEFNYIFNCTAFVSETRLFIPKDFRDFFLSKTI